jgi:hypothetical protein
MKVYLVTYCVVRKIIVKIALSFFISTLLCISGLLAMEEPAAKKRKTDSALLSSASLDESAFARLPNEIILSIVDQVALEDVKDIANTCKYFHALINDRKYTLRIIKREAEKLKKDREEFLTDKKVLEKRNQVCPPDLIAASALGTDDAIKYIKKNYYKPAWTFVDEQGNEYEREKGQALTDAFILIVGSCRQNSNNKKQIGNTIISLVKAGANANYKIAEDNLEYDDFSRIGLSQNSSLYSTSYEESLTMAIKKGDEFLTKILLAAGAYIDDEQDFESLVEFAKQQKDTEKKYKILNILFFLSNYVWKNYQIDLWQE